MVKNILGNGNQYEGIDSINPKKELFLKKFKEMTQKGEFIYFLNPKDGNSEKYHIKTDVAYLDTPRKT